MKKEENGVLEQTEDEKRRKTEQERKAVAPIENNGEEKRMGEEKQFNSPKALLITKIQDRIKVQEVDPTNTPTLEELEKGGEQIASTKIKRGEEASAYG